MYRVLSLAIFTIVTDYFTKKEKTIRLKKINCTVLKFVFGRLKNLLKSDKKIRKKQILCILSNWL